MSIGTELHSHLTTAFKLGWHSPEVVRTLLSHSDIPLLKVDTLSCISILRRRPLGYRLIVRISFEVEEIDLPFGRESTGLHRDLVWGVEHIPLRVIDRSSDHRSIEAEGQVVGIVASLPILYLSTKSRRSEVHREGIGFACVIEVARPRDRSATRGSINTLDTDSARYDDIRCRRIKSVRRRDINTRLIVVAFLREDGERALTNRHTPRSRLRRPTLLFEGEIELLLITDIPSELQAGVLIVNDILLEEQTDFV